MADETEDLTPTSFIVLGFVDWAGRASPYELKQQLQASVGNFWSVPHSQVYAEAARLAGGGYLSESQEHGGRRRKEYALTAKGRKALNRWRRAPTDQLPELRDFSLLKLFFGAGPEALASTQAAAHREKLETYQQTLESDIGEEPRGPWLALEAGVMHEREWVRFWSRLAAGDR